MRKKRVPNKMMKNIKIFATLLSLAAAGYFTVLYQQYRDQEEAISAVCDIEVYQDFLCNEAKAKARDSEAQLNLFYMYLTGRDVDKDDEKSIYWLSKAAEQGHSQAQYHLGILYLNDTLITKDYKKAYKWLTKASLQEEWGAQIILGVMYRDGQGVAVDYQEAIQCFKASLWRGVSKSQYHLGRTYYLMNNFDEALVWFGKSAEYAHPEALYQLGVMHHQGQGVTHDYLKAYMYFSLSSKEDHVLAIEHLNTVAEAMTPPQITKGEEMVKAWIEMLRERPYSRDQSEEEMQLHYSLLGQCGDS